MAQLYNFIYCVEAKISGGKQGEIISVKGMSPTLTPHVVPGDYSFSVVMTISGLDPSRKNTVRVVLSKGNAAVADSGFITVPPQVSAPVSHFEGSCLNMSLDFRNIYFAENGVYTATVYANEDEIGKKDVLVFGQNAKTGGLK